MMATIRVAKDFSLMPSGRSYTDGSYTGEHFYDYLVHTMDSIPDDEKIIVNFDGILSAGSSFLEQSFAGLIRKKNITKKQFPDKFIIEANDYPEIREKILRYVKEA